MTGNKAFSTRFRSFLLIVPALLAAYTVAGAASPAMANHGETPPGNSP